jgi:hypothetical protein
VIDAHFTLESLKKMHSSVNSVHTLQAMKGGLIGLKKIEVVFSDTAELHLEILEFQFIGSAGSYPFAEVRSVLEHEDVKQLVKSRRQTVASPSTVCQATPGIASASGTANPAAGEEKEEEVADTYPTYQPLTNKDVDDIKALIANLCNVGETEDLEQTQLDGEPQTVNAAADRGEPMHSGNTKGSSISWDLSSSAKDGVDEMPEPEEPAKAKDTKANNSDSNNSNHDENENENKNEKESVALSQSRSESSRPRDLVVMPSLGADTQDRATEEDEDEETNPHADLLETPMMRQAQTYPVQTQGEGGGSSLSQSPARFAVLHSLFPPSIPLSESSGQSTATSSAQKRSASAASEGAEKDVPSQSKRPRAYDTQLPLSDGEAEDTIEPFAMMVGTLDDHPNTALNGSVMTMSLGQTHSLSSAASSGPSYPQTQLPNTNTNTTSQDAEARDTSQVTDPDNDPDPDNENASSMALVLEVGGLTAERAASVEQEKEEREGENLTLSFEASEANLPISQVPDDIDVSCPDIGIPVPRVEDMIGWIPETQVKQIPLTLVKDENDSVPDSPPPGPSNRNDGDGGDEDETALVVHAGDMEQQRAVPGRDVPADESPERSPPRVRSSTPTRSSRRARQVDYADWF